MKHDLLDKVTSPESLPASASMVSPYPSWHKNNGAPMDVDSVKSVFDDLQAMFGFQKASSVNMFQYLMLLLESRSSRMPCNLALVSIHADYIGGDNANYKKWYFAAAYDLDHGYTDKKSIRAKWKELPQYLQGKHVPNGLKTDANGWWAMETSWRQRMRAYTEEDYLKQLALYLLIWGEANNVRFMPECLCFIYRCALDYMYSFQDEAPPGLPEFYFLDNIITPIYNYIRDQQFDAIDGKFFRKLGKDHSHTVGYDDVNLFFWFDQNLKKISLEDGTNLIDHPSETHYTLLHSVDWNNVFFKSYYETRSWFHLIVNFSRIWIIHLSMFWYFFTINTPVLYTKNYMPHLDNRPAPQVQLCVIGLGGAVACLVVLIATLFEAFYVPMKYPGRRRLFWRAVLTTLLLGFNVAIPTYVFIMKGWDKYSKLGIGLGVFQIIWSIFTTFYLGMTPPSCLFSPLLQKNTNNYKATLFTANYAQRSTGSRISSMVLWSNVYLFKTVESYFFLTLSLKDPFKALFTMDTSRCTGDVWLGSLVCKHFPFFAAGLLLVTNFVLFCLDTYLWYIICNSVFSAVLSYSSGTSTLKPWKTTFDRLPTLFLSKVHFPLCSLQKDNFAISKLWNCIVISLYRDHLVSVEQANRLVYQHDPTETPWRAPTIATPPNFFGSQDDGVASDAESVFSQSKESARRISFFARSLTCQWPESYLIEGLPSFTVLIPHYSETMVIGQKALLKERPGCKISLLDYLKKMHKKEWRSFVREAKLMDAVLSSSIPNTADSALGKDLVSPGSLPESAALEGKFVDECIDDIPYNSVGYKNSFPEFAKRTRIWASLRCQTLYRTITGFMNYQTALKALYFSETYSFESEHLADQAELELELDRFVSRKFRLLVSMQRYLDFDLEEQELVEMLRSCNPNLKICYIEKSGEFYYSVLLGSRNGSEEGTPLRIRLSGNPIIGDGKSDNQNHAVIFQRGEYLQTIDANQDNYIEECLKIKAVFAEFEEIQVDPSSTYEADIVNAVRPAPIAFLGAREFIFSEKTGVLGDIAAGKEQTFGTLFARTLSKVDAKLHYGHPDFINTIFMFTRGGISKAQKGLHLNEDIYSGMNAISRGGRIKHCDYYQCGKGRDMGFGSIVNFTTKIGAGMGEQSLSRELFNLGTTLPIDRFLSFYYAHAGFHINNVFIILSVELFLLIFLTIGALKFETISCEDIPGSLPTDPKVPSGCADLSPVLKWIARFIRSLFICFFISFLPLWIQEFTEKSFFKAISRLALHFVSMAPLFEVLVCKVYSNSFKENLRIGGAKYVATGRGLAISRFHFHELYTKYADVSICSGGFGFMAVIFGTITMWHSSHLWFYFTCTSLVFAPFLFNPHQFALREFILDYKHFLHWIFSEQTKANSSWSLFRKRHRSRFTGVKKKLLNVQGKHLVELNSPSRWSRLHLDVLYPAVEFCLYLVPYLFITAQSGVKNPTPVNPIMRVLILSLLPVVLNFIFLIVTFPVNFVLGNTLGLCCGKYPKMSRGLTFVWSLVNFAFLIQVVIHLHEYSIARTLCAFVCITKFQTWLRNVIYTLCLTKELDTSSVSSSWWLGKWSLKTLSWLVVTQPLRELFVKTTELTMLGFDFFLGTLVYSCMVPIALFPWSDKLHCTILFWFEPSSLLHLPILSKKQKRKRNIAVAKYIFVYLFIVGAFVGSFVLIIFLRPTIEEQRSKLPAIAQTLFQPGHQQNNDTGDVVNTLATVRLEDVRLRTVA